VGSGGGDALGADVASALAKVRVGPPAGTAYSRLGDWFAWLTVVVFVVCLAAGARPIAREVVRA
jgi:hypothetical protein